LIKLKGEELRKKSTHDRGELDWGRMVFFGGCLNAGGDCISIRTLVERKNQGVCWHRKPPEQKKGGEFIEAKKGEEGE